MSANTPQKLDGSLAESILSTVQDNATAEPTAGGVLDAIEVHPQGGYEMVFPPGQEPVIPGGGRLGIECTAPAAVNCRAKLVCEE